MSTAIVWTIWCDSCSSESYSIVILRSQEEIVSPKKFANHFSSGKKKKVTERNHINVKSKHYWLYRRFFAYVREQHEFDIAWIRYKSSCSESSAGDRAWAVAMDLWLLRAEPRLFLQRMFLQRRRKTKTSTCARFRRSFGRRIIQRRSSAAGLFSLMWLRGVKPPILTRAAKKFRTTNTRARIPTSKFSFLCEAALSGKVANRAILFRSMRSGVIALCSPRPRSNAAPVYL